MKQLTHKVLAQETAAFQGSGGTSAESSGSGFRPAFRDERTGVVYASCFRDGRPASFHLLDGLPDELVISRNEAGAVVAVQGCVTSGFVKEGRFYTREEAAEAVSETRMDPVPVAADVCT